VRRGDVADDVEDVDSSAVASAGLVRLVFFGGFGAFVDVDAVVVSDAGSLSPALAVDEVSVDPEVPDSFAVSVVVVSVVVAAFSSVAEAATVSVDSA
jgi:hypothetical protein